jgi:hypothetical protein
MHSPAAPREKPRFDEEAEKFYDDMEANMRKVDVQCLVIWLLMFVHTRNQQYMHITLGK